MKYYKEVTFCGQLKTMGGSDAKIEDIQGYCFNTKIDFSGVEGVDEFDEIVDFSDFLQNQKIHMSYAND